MLKPLMILIVAICFSVSGEMCLKSGMNQIGVFSFSNLLPTLGKILSHPRIWTGFGLFTIGAFFWLSVLSRVNLSWAYPLLSIGYILVLIVSAVVLKEHISAVRWIGAIVISIGVVLVFRS
jgi:multidrug transporter EmrE-like cation transporter